MERVFVRLAASSGADNLSAVAWYEDTDGKFTKVDVSNPSGRSWLVTVSTADGSKTYPVSPPAGDSTHVLPQNLRVAIGTVAGDSGPEPAGYWVSARGA